MGASECCGHQTIREASDVIYTDEQLQKKAHRWFGLDMQIKVLRRAMGKIELRMDVLGEEYCPPNHCCPSCASSEYRALCTKYENQEKWMNVLLAKKKVRQGDQSPHKISTRCTRATAQ